MMERIYETIGFRPGDTVFWKDPEGITSGKCIVREIQADETLYKNGETIRKEDITVVLDHWNEKQGAFEENGGTEAPASECLPVSGKEFSREESIIIESFLDLYCHDCPDKECEGCRVSDLFAYLDDMGETDEDR